MNKTVNFFLVRHGQTLFNQLNRMQGWCDSPLTPLGIDQAKNLGYGLNMANIIFDKAFSSNSERAFDTANIIVSATIPVYRSKQLKEIFFGTCEGSITKEAHKGRGTNFEVDWTNVGGENFLTVKERLEKKLNEIFKQADDKQTILIVTHGGAITAYLSQFSNFPYDEIISGKLPPIGNCSISKIEYSHENKKLINFDNSIFCNLGKNNNKERDAFYENYHLPID